MLANSPLLPSKKYLLFLSRIHQKKGVDLLIKAYKKTKSAVYGKLPQLVIAGPGLDTEFGKEIKELADNEPDIIFPGMLSGQLKWAAFYGCEAFILPSHQENFGIAVVEALASGKPVLISDKVNIWREIDREKAGIVMPDTEEGVHQTLLKWFSMSPDEKGIMAEQATIAFAKHFTVEQAAKRTVEVIKEETYG